MFNASDEDGIEGGKSLEQARDNPGEPEYEESRLDAEGIVRADELEDIRLEARQLLFGPIEHHDHGSSRH